MVFILAADCRSVSAQVSGLKPSTEAAKDLFLRVGSSREKIAAYECEIELNTTIRSKALRLPLNEGISRLKIEYIGFTNHFVVARFDRNSNGDQNDWIMAGRSESAKISGSSNQKVLIEDWTKERSQLPFYFDPRSTGIGSLGNYVSSITFEQTIGGYIMRKHSELNAKVNAISETRIEYSTNEPLHIVFDSKADYWPVSYSIWEGSPDATTWLVTLAKQGEYHMPSTAKLECALGIQVDMRFRWNSINQPIPTGLESARKWSSFLHAKLDDQRAMNKAGNRVKKNEL